jgi:hypothetical protein
VVVVLAATEYQRLLAGTAGPRGSFAAHLLAFPGEDLPRASVAPRDVTF